MLHRDAGPEGVALLRWVVFGLWFITILGAPPLTLTAGLPPGFFSPPGVLALLPEGLWDVLLTPQALAALTVAALALTLAAAVGIGPYAMVGPLAFVGVFLFDGIQKGQGGFINHAQFGILYGALLLALSPAGDALTPFRRQPRKKRSSGGAYRYPLVGLALLLAVAYSLIGIHRFAMGGLAIFTGDALPINLALRTFEYREFGFEWSVVLLQHAPFVVLLKAGFFVVTLFEVLTPLALIWRRFRWSWLAVMVPFHLSTLFTMNIFFWENLILLAVVFTNLPTAVGQKFQGRGEEDHGPIIAAVPGGGPAQTR